jgi:hypothetical protein
MQYIHEREEQALRGITQYKQVADRWGEVLRPYEQQLRQYNIDPYKAVSNLVAVHTVLRFGTPQQKAQLASMLDKDYGLAQYYRGAPGQPPAPPPGPDLTPLQNKVAQMEAALQRRELGEAQDEVERFISDPANKFAGEAAPRMLELLEQNRASSLKEAYEVAVRTDPVLFEKLIAERISAATRPPAPAPTNTRPSATRPSTAGAVRGTIDDTMRETLSKINQR